MGLDVLLDQDFDLQIEDGDFIIGNDLEQRCCCILNASAGHYRQWPIIGGNVRAYLNGPFGQQSLQQIQLHLEADLIKAKSILFNGGELQIDANSKI